MEPGKKISWFIKDNISNGTGIVLFTSDEGRKVFSEANNSGFLNSYFELSAQFLTSFEPSYSCGLASLTMVLNTFGVDPGRIWKDMYRWYKETMLDHCVPYNIIVNNGIVFQQFACMAVCNNIDVEVICNAKESASLDEFREICKKITSERCDRILVCCYDRYSLDQVGTGHYSPIGGYHPERDLVLVFDISRYKYPLHWLPLESLWKAMKVIDAVTGNPRGYFVLRKPTETTKPSPLFKTVTSLDQTETNHRGWIDFFNIVLLPWHRWMSELKRNCINEALLLRNVMSKLLENFQQSNCSGVGHLNGIHIGLEFQDADPSLDKACKECLVCQLRKSLETSILYKEAQGRVERQCNSLCSCWAKLVTKQQNEHKCCKIDTQPSLCHLREFTLVHFIVMIILSWPYGAEKRNKDDEGGYLEDVHSSMTLIVFTELSNLDEILKAEVKNTKKRLSVQLNKETYGS